LPTVLVRSAWFVAAALALSSVAQAQIPIAPRETELAPPAPEPAAPAPEPAAPAPEPAPVLVPPSPPAAPAAGEANQPVPAKSNRLKERVAPSDDADEYYEDESGSTERPRRTWYGWQTLIADGISMTVFFAAFSDNDNGADNTNETLAWTGLLGYELAPGIVHFAHRNPGRGFASMGIRFGMPLAGAFLGGAAASDCHGEDCTAAGIGAGILLGMAGAIAIDAALLAFDYPVSTARSAKHEGLRPLFSLSAQHAFVGLSGEL
jgi:hypothetical protein